MKHPKLSTKLYLVGALLIAVAVSMGTIGIIGLRTTNTGLETIYNDRVVPLQQLKAIADAYAVSIVDAANKANAGLFTVEEALKDIEAARATITRNWKAYRATFLSIEETKLANETEALFAPADAAVAKLRQHLTGKTGHLTATLGDFDGPLYAQIDPISGKISELAELQLRVARAEYDATHARFKILLWLSLGTLIVGTLLSGGFSWRVVHTTTGRLHRLTENLSQGAEQTAAAAQQVSSSSQLLAQGASEQAASLEETSASLEELASMTTSNSSHSTKMNELARQARAAADNGSADMQGMRAAMKAIKDSSDDIAKIIRTIDQIAFQTNILALNAAVEAARAGDAGLGFAVVADEVRNLAQRSAQAAKETAGMIEGAITNSAQGVQITEQVAKALDDILTKVRQVDELAAEVAAASAEQTQGINQINNAVGQMDQVIQTNAANAEESASASEELNGQADSLRLVVKDLQSLIGGNNVSRPDDPVASQSRVPATRQPAIKPPAKNGTKTDRGALNGHGRQDHSGPASTDRASSGPESTNDREFLDF